MDMAKVTSKGQITIPVSIRRKLNINEGDKLLFINRVDGVMMVNPDMLPAGQSADTVHMHTPEPEPVMNPVVYTRRGAVIPPVRSSIPPPRSDGFDVGALLDEIRSIGSKI